MNVTVAIDAISGDHGPVEIIPAVLSVLKKHSNVHFILVGEEKILLKTLADNSAAPSEQISIKHASQHIAMHELPHKALRNKKDSSMRVAIDLVHSADAQACVSAGNTGALMAISKFVLKTLPGIERPAICSALPTLGDPTYMLDLGANVGSNAEQLLQFAMMGSTLVNIVEDIVSPTVALLNIGVEGTKGNDQIKLAASFLAESDLNYCGFAEGTDLYRGKFNVVICDGFLGNIALKSSEGTVILLTQLARNISRNSLYGRLISLLGKPILSKIFHMIDPNAYNGASLLGLKEVVVKSHGSADRLSFAYAIEVAITESKNNIPKKISAKLEKLMV